MADEAIAPVELSDEQVEQVAGGIGSGETGTPAGNDGPVSDDDKQKASSKLYGLTCTGTHIAKATVGG